MHVVETVFGKGVSLFISSSLEISVGELVVGVSSEVGPFVGMSFVEVAVKSSEKKSSVVDSSVVSSVGEVCLDSLLVVYIAVNVDLGDVSIVGFINEWGGVVGFDATWKCFNQSRYTTGSSG